MNPKTGRFMQEDPARSGLNWYTYAANNPILFIDPLGLKIQLQGSPEERQRILEQLRKLTDGTIDMDKKGYLSYTFGDDSKTLAANGLIQSLIDSKYTNEIYEYIDGTGNSYTQYTADQTSGAGAAQIFFDTQSTATLIMTNPNTGLAEEKAGETYMFLAHEMIHANRMNQGTFTPSKGWNETMQSNIVPYSKGRFITKYYGEKINREEFATMGMENIIRQEQNLLYSNVWLRAAYHPTFDAMKKSPHYFKGWRWN